MKLRLATWNLERPWRTPNGARASRLRQQIATISADVWVLTETAESFSLPGTTAHWSSSGNPPPNYDSSERAVSIHIREDWSGRLVKRTQLSVAVSVSVPDVAPLLVVGHLIPYRDAHDGPGWRKHLHELETSIGQWRAWRADPRFADHLMLIAGDFNMTLHDGRGYGTAQGRRLIAQAMKDCNLRCLTAVDIRRIEGLGIARDSVDHLIVDGRLSVVGDASFWPGRTMAGPMSDHNGAFATLVI